MTMVSVKGNDGKALRSKMSAHFLIFVVVAVATVAVVKSLGTAPWHAGAAMDDHAMSQSQKELVVAERHRTPDMVAEAPGAKTADEGTQDQEKTLIKFVFGRLDGGDEEGEVIVKLRPDWAPLGVNRIQELTAAQFWDGCHAFRVLPNFMVQLGINGDPEIQKRWRKHIADDPVKASNTRGMVTFAMAGPGTRTTQIFFNTVNNSRLDKERFSPFGEVISGMDTIDRIYSGYREKPSQGLIQQQGNAYLEKNFPLMSYIKHASFAS